MPETITVSLDARSLEPVKQMLAAAASWMAEVSTRERTEAEDALCDALMDLLDADQG